MRKATGRLTLVVGIVAALCSVGFASGPAAGAAVTFVNGGTAAPAATLGPFTMTPFGVDATPDNTDVTSVVDPAGTLTFNQPVSKRTVGSGWSTWSHGYTGSVYFNNGADEGDTNNLTIGLPAGTSAFYFYAEPNDFDPPWNVTATAQDGTTSGPISVSGSGGATYFGFYGNPANPLVSISINAEAGASGFAVGEFGISKDGFSSNIAVNAVSTSTESPASVAVTVTCTYGVPVNLVVPVNGSPVIVPVASSTTLVNTCSFAETPRAGDTSTVSYACAGTSPSPTPVCVTPGPQVDPISARALAASQTAAVTITNTYPIVLAPRFTG